MDVPERKVIGDCLQELRKKAGFSSANAFADSLGINRGTYTGYEQGKGMFSYEQAWIMADALKCSMDELGGRKWPPDGDTATPEEAELARIYRDVNADGQRAMMTNARAVAAEYTTPETDSHPASSQVKGL